MVLKRASAAVALGLLLSSSVTMAANQTLEPKQQHQQSALQPGKAAGVHKARWVFANGRWFWIGGAALVIGGVALVASGGHSSTTTTTTTKAP